MQNYRYMIFVFFTLLIACANSNERKLDNSLKWKNPFPNIMEEVSVQPGTNFKLSTKLIASSLEFDCSLRNDSPYYWCGIDADFVKKDPKVPSTLSGLYHSVVDMKGKKESEKVIRSMKKSNGIVTAIMIHDTYIANYEGKDYISTRLLSLYNDKYCITFFGYDKFCPRTAQITYF